jgi:hypothetical protein
MTLRIYKAPKSKSWLPGMATSTLQALKGATIYIPSYVVAILDGDSKSPENTVISPKFFPFYASYFCHSFARFYA